jgi:hypothetical protein
MISHLPLADNLQKIPAGWQFRSGLAYWRGTPSFPAKCATQFWASCVAGATCCVSESPFSFERFALQHGALTRLVKMHKRGNPSTRLLPLTRTPVAKWSPDTCTNLHVDRHPLRDRILLSRFRLLPNWSSSKSSKSSGSKSAVIKSSVISISAAPAPAPAPAPSQYAGAGACACTWAGATAGLSLTNAVSASAPEFQSAICGCA